MARKGKLKESPTESEQRPVRIKRYGYLFLIVCEDEKTEKEYFENFRSAFPEKTVYLRTIGTGRDPRGVVETAVQERGRLALEAEKEVDTVWAVFDKDDADLNPARRVRFDEGLDLAEQEGIHLAFSNEVFELWLLLFLTEVSPAAAIPRGEIYRQIGEEVRKKPGHDKFEYKHGDTEILGIIRTIGDEAEAHRRAALLLDAQSGKHLIEANPSTRVHLLVKEIREWIAYYTYIPD